MFSSLYYLQLGLQALDDFLPQGILSLVGAFALGWGTLLTFQRRPASGIVFLGTLPILFLHAKTTADDPGELPFLIGSLPVPLIAGLVWLVVRRAAANSVSRL